MAQPKREKGLFDRETPLPKDNPGAAIQPLVPTGSPGAFMTDDVEDDRLRVTAYLSLDQIERLDMDRQRIRRARRVIMDRTAIIRGLIEGYRRSGLDLVEKGVRTEEEVATLVARLLSGGSHE